jgi:hypothetical protein
MRRSCRALKSWTDVFKANGVEVEYRVEKRRVKYPRLEFKTGSLLVVLPENMKSEEDILERKKSWIIRKYREIQEVVNKINESLDEDEAILFGRKLKIVPSEEPSIDFERGKVLINPESEAHHRKIKKQIRKILREKIEEAVEEYSEKLCLKPGKIFIKNQRSKWASCSSNGNLSFNLKLAVLPEELMRYVVFHEVVHLKEKRHSKRFWSIVEKEFEDFKANEKKLTEYWFYIHTGYKLPIFNGNKACFQAHRFSEVSWREWRGGIHE